MRETQQNEFRCLVEKQQWTEFVLCVVTYIDLTAISRHTEGEETGETDDFFNTNIFLRLFNDASSIEII
jgi:hypothetical protein